MMNQNPLTEDVIDKRFWRWADSIDLPHGLTKKKIQDRGEDWQYGEGTVSFSMTRHKPVLGNVRGGRAMGAFIETEERYTYDANADELSPAGPSSDRLVVEDMSSCADTVCDGDSVDVTRNGETYCVDLPTTNDQLFASNYEEAAAGITRLVEEWALEDAYFVEISEIISKQECSRICSDLQKACVACMLEKLASAWKDAGGEVR